MSILDFAGHYTEQDEAQWYAEHEHSQSVESERVKCRWCFSTLDHVGQEHKCDGDEPI